jgi:hypothetical protein
MVFYYFDTETTSNDPTKAELVTIQYRRLGKYDFHPTEPLKILKCWEMSEKDMLLAFAPKFVKWEFMPVGQNLRYDYVVLDRRIKANGLREAFHLKSLEDLLDFPDWDAKHAMVMMNGLSYTGYDKVAGGPEGGSKLAAQHIAAKDWPRLEQYVHDEHEAFMNFLNRSCHKCRGIAPSTYY